jgi:hypothetical protein
MLTSQPLTWQSDTFACFSTATYWLLCHGTRGKKPALGAAIEEAVIGDFFFELERLPALLMRMMRMMESMSERAVATQLRMKGLFPRSIF